MNPRDTEKRKVWEALADALDTELGNADSIVENVRAGRVGVDLERFLDRVVALQKLLGRQDYCSYCEGESNAVHNFYVRYGATF